MNPTTCGPPCRRIHVMGPQPPRRARLKPARSVAVRSSAHDTARMLGEVLDTLDALKTVVITQAMSQREFPMSNTEPERDYATDPQYKPKPDNRFPDEMDQISWSQPAEPVDAVREKAGETWDVMRNRLDFLARNSSNREEFERRAAPVIAKARREVSEVTPEPVEGSVSRWTCGGREVYPSEPAARQIATQGLPEGTQPYVEECADCGGWHTEPRAFPVTKERLCQKVRYATSQIAEAMKRVYEEIEPKCETCGGFHLRDTRLIP